MATAVTLLTYTVLNVDLGVHGDTNVTAVDIVDRVGKETRREKSGGLFVFIGADAETQWLPAEIARDEADTF